MKQILLYLFPVSLLFYSCESSSGNEDDSDDVPSQTDTTETDNSEQTGTLNFEAFPSPVRISYLFYQAHLDFQETLLYPVANYESRQLTSERLIAFGVYSSDLAYSAFNQRDTEAKERFILLENISNDLGFSYQNDHEELLQRFENNITNMDSMIHLLSRYQMEVDEYIQMNNEEEKALVIFASAWVETLYLAASVKNFDVNAELIETLMYQSELSASILNNLNQAESFIDDAAFSKLKAGIFNINQAFTEIGLPEDETVEYEIKRTALHLLIDKIFETRQSITGEL
jgi:hypothetical protein